MTETPPDPDPYPWLPATRTRAWVGLTPGDDPQLLASAEDCRRAAADWCQDQRPDLWQPAPAGDLPAVTFAATERIVMAGLIATARLYARKGSTAGLASYAELGPAGVLALDPDVARMLGTGVHARPAIG